MASTTVVEARNASGDILCELFILSEGSGVADCTTVLYLSTSLVTHGVAHKYISSPPILLFSSSLPLLPSLSTDSKCPVRRKSKGSKARAG